MYKKITISEVAKLANVSTATVSRALNDSPTVKESTRQRILSVANTLEAQRTNKRGSSKVLLASFPELTNPFYSEIFRGILDSASVRGYDVLFFSMSNYSMPESYTFLYEGNFFGGLIIAHAIPDIKVLDRLREKVPVVMCTDHNEEDVAFVGIDNFRAAYTAVNYLISTGRRRIALINSSLRNNYAVKREEAYRACLAANGIDVKEEWILRLPDIDYNICLNSSTALLSMADRPDAVFCVSDVYAAATISAARSLGLDIPGDAAVVGFDNIDISTMTSPSITTIAQPTYQIGTQACNMLMDQIEYPGSTPRQIILNTELILRNST